MQLKEFNLEEWEKKCIIYDKNRIGLKFDVNVKLKEGRLSVTFNNLDQKYIGTIKELMLKNAIGAVQYLNQIFNPTYTFSQDDYDKVSERNFTLMKEHTEMYLKILFTEGYDAFMTHVQQQTAILQAQYELSRISYKEGNWILPDGQVWEQNGWMKDGNMNYSVLLGPMWETLLGHGVLDEKIA